jgi:hypothetical protein
LIKLTGTVEELTAEIKRRRDLKNPSKILQAIEYFEKLRNMCKVHKLLESNVSQEDETKTG